jgi:hypothetical protein
MPDIKGGKFFMRRIYKPAKKSKSRDQLQSEALQNMQKIREKMDPDLLERMHRLITEGTASQNDLPDRIPIDRKRNTQMVMDFLNSPQGAHLRAKILNQ